MRVMSAYVGYIFVSLSYFLLFERKKHKSIDSIYFEYSVLFSVTNESLSFVRKMYPKPKRNQFKFRRRYVNVSL